MNSLLAPRGLQISGTSQTLGNTGGARMGAPSTFLKFRGEIALARPVIPRVADARARPRLVLEQGGAGWEKIQSEFSAARNWDADVHTAYAIQIALGLMLAASLAWLWHSDAAFEPKASALATARLLATPCVLDDDLVVLGGATGIPAGLMVMFALYSLTVRRAVADRAGVAIPAPHIAQA